MEFIGSIAGILTTISLLPQVISIIKSKNVEGLSLVYFTLLLTGVFLWTIYGFLKNSPSLIVANIISFIFVSIIVISILKYKKK